MVSRVISARKSLTTAAVFIVAIDGSGVFSGPFLLVFRPRLVFRLDLNIGTLLYDVVCPIRYDSVSLFLRVAGKAERD